MKQCTKFIQKIDESDFFDSKSSSLTRDSEHVTKLTSIR